MRSTRVAPDLSSASDRVSETVSTAIRNGMNDFDSSMPGMGRPARKTRPAAGSWQARGGLKHSTNSAARSVARHRGLVERGADTLGELHGVVVRPEMHEVQARLLVQHVAVQGRHLDAVLPQRLDHRIDLV